MFERESAGPCGWGRPLCYLWGCSLSVSRTPGAVQAQSSVGGRPACRRCESQPRPAPLAGAAGHPLPRWAGDRGWLEAGVSATRGAPPARPGPPGDGRRRGTPAPPLPAGRRGDPLPKGPPQPFAAAGGQGREGAGGRGGGLCCWPAVRPSIRPAAGRG